MLGQKALDISVSGDTCPDYYNPQADKSDTQNEKTRQASQQRQRGREQNHQDKKLEQHIQGYKPTAICASDAT